MTEQPPGSPPGEESTDPSELRQEQPEQTVEPTAEPSSTGVPAVDQVLGEVDDLDEVPLEEHLGWFERAHETLRSALDAEPGDPG
jgi:hypothetical protein